MRPKQTPRVDLLTLALSACILTYVWRVQDLYPIFATVKLPMLASLAALMLYVIDSTPRRCLAGVKHPITTAASAILVLAVLSVPGSVYQGLSFRFIVDDLGKNFLVFVILAASIRSFRDVRRFAAVILGGGVLYAWYVYTQVSVGISGRLGNLVYYDANDVGMLLVSTLPIGLFFVLRGSSNKTRVAALAALFLFMLVIIKTGSRGAFIGLVGTAAYILFSFKSVAARWRIGIVTAGVAGMMLAGGEQYWALMSTLLNPTEDYNWSGGAESGRMEVWKRGMGYMLQNPMTGVGVDAFPVAEGMISELADRQQYGIGLKWSAAHNSFVQAGAELGIFGLIAYCLLLLRAFRTARGPRRPRTSATMKASDEDLMGQALAGSVVGYAVTAFFLSQAYAAYAFVLYALIVGLDRVRQRSVDVTPRSVSTAIGGQQHEPIPSPVSVPAQIASGSTS